MKKFFVEPKVFEILPKYSVGGVLIEILKERSADQSEEYIQNALAHATKGSSKLRAQDTEEWKGVMNLINASGCEPSHVSLFNRIRKDVNKMPRINKIVDIYNALSIKHALPVGAHDVTEFDEMHVGFTTSASKFQPIGAPESTNTQAHELAYLTADTVLTRHLVWRQSEHCKITTTSRRIFFPFDGLNITPNKLALIMDELLAVLASSYEFKYSQGIVTKFNPSLEFTHWVDSNNIKPQSFLFARPTVDSSKESVDKFFDRKLDLIYPNSDELRKAMLSGQRLRFYFGADATAPKLHIGHAVPLQKMSELQELGHELIFLIGDFTARIGDPTDKSAARTKLTAEEVARNASVFIEQISRYVNLNHPKNPAQIVFNSTWNETLTMTDVIDLASNFTVQQMLERDMFEKRLAENKPIYLHEFLYPLLQGYDSTYLEVDGEFGGRDQTFNMLAGRTLQKIYSDIDKFVVTTPFLLSADGKTKMSKSIGNCIFVEDTPADKFGKVMSIPDDLIIHYFELATNLDTAEIKSYQDELATNKITAMDLKKKLAFEVTKIHDGDQAAQDALDVFEKVIQQGQAPANVPTISRKNLEPGITMKSLLVSAKLATSGSEAKRLIQSGAVYIDNQKYAGTPDQVVDINLIQLIKVGKREWLKLVD